MPFLHAVSLERVAEINFRFTDSHRSLLIESAVCIQQFARLDPDSGASFPAHLQPRPAGKVLPEIINVFPGFTPRNFHSLEPLHHFQRSRRLSAKFSARTAIDRCAVVTCLSPRGIVKAKLAPAGLIAPRIKILAAVNAGKSYRTFFHPPQMIGADHRNGAVRVFDPQHDPHFGCAEGGCVFGIAPAGNTVEPVGEFPSNNIRAVTNQIGNFIRDIINRLAEIRPVRCQHRVADFASVQENFMESG